MDLRVVSLRNIDCSLNNYSIYHKVQFNSYLPTNKNILDLPLTVLCWPIFYLLLSLSKVYWFFQEALLIDLLSIWAQCAVALRCTPFCGL